MSHDNKMSGQTTEKESITDLKKTWIDKLIDYFKNDTEKTNMEIKRLNFSKRQSEIKIQPHQKME